MKLTKEHVKNRNESRKKNGWWKNPIKTKQRMRESCQWLGKFGPDSSKWTDNQTSERSIHNWLNKQYGRAELCENPICEHKSTHFEYALLKDKKHDYHRKNYWKLCRKCHSEYDQQAKKSWITRRNNILKSMKKTNEYIEQISEVISILHDLKHSGKLPKELEEWRSWIETFNPDKITKVETK